ncbi:MAG: cyclic lactone autoinducer peptide [Desulfotomaculaceae bacterium]|nr:cyclic lactone autoinducer peptide [Desulfotomaculaceae bacterium]
MKKLWVRVLLFTVSALLLLANIAAASTCLISQYQPEMPQCLRR